jgi:hypothetical protein
MLAAIYYLGLLLAIPGAAFALIAYVLRGTLGDIVQDIGKVLSFLGKIDTIVPREWGSQWGFAILVLIAVAVLAVGIFVLVAGGVERARPFGAAIVLAVGSLSLATILRYESLRATELAIFALVACAGSVLASAYVLWRAWPRA